MKELSIEEKAKRYDEAIKRANSLLSGNQLGNAWIYELLPELKEGEDRKIKNDIQYAVRCAYGDNSEQTNKILDWLEKQGEQKPAEEYNITGIGSKHAQGKLGEMIKNLKSAWGEEGENIIEWLIGYLEYQIMNVTITEEKNNCLNAISMLKSLKERCTWRPSDEQIEALVSAIDVMIDNRGAGDKKTVLLSGLYHELKAL